MQCIQKKQYRSAKSGALTTSWVARYRAPDGRERSKRFARKVDAQRWLDTNAGDIVRQAWVDPRLGKKPFADYAKEWLATKADVSERTLINIEGRVRNHLIPHFDGMELAAIRPKDVRALVSKMSAAGRAPDTVKSTYQIAAQIFAQAVSDELIAKTPCVDVRLPKNRQRTEMHFLRPDQVNDLAGAIDDRYRAMIYTAAYGGLRAGELAAIRVSDLSLGDLGGTIAVTKSLSEVRGALKEGTTKTGRARVVTIPRWLSAMLADHVKAYSAGYVFTAGEGGPVQHSNFVDRHFGPAVKRADLPEDLRFHDLRHTCAAILISSGRHMEEVKDHLGHASIRTTSDTYAHLFDTARAELADTLEATFQNSVNADAGDTRAKSDSPALRRVR